MKIFQKNWINQLLIYFNLVDTTKDTDQQMPVLDSIVVSIPACHAGDQGSIPCRGALFKVKNKKIKTGPLLANKTAPRQGIEPWSPA